MIGLDDIEAAARRLEGHVAHTPCEYAPRLSALLETEIFLKGEQRQATASFKERGARTKLESLSAGERRQGVIAMSAGNHAQGVACHAARLDIPATIVMPHFTPFIKVEKTTRYGAEALLQGASIEEAAEVARRLAGQRGLTFIHPFDDPLIIAGQGTIALEMLTDQPGLEVLIVPIGGGGLIAGMAIAAKALKPAIEIVGVQAQACPSMYRALRGLPPVAASATIAEGIAVHTPGKRTLPIVASTVDRTVLVEEKAIEDAILTLLEVEKTVVEGAGAAGLAALMSDPASFRGKRVGLVLCGGNIDLRTLSDVILRGMVRSRRLIEIGVDVADAPGLLARVATHIGQAGGNIVEVAHQRAFSPLSVKSTEMTFVIETRNAGHADEILTNLKSAGLGVRLLHQNDAGDKKTP